MWSNSQCRIGPRPAVLFFSAVFALLGCKAAVAEEVSAASVAKQVVFESDIIPILKAYCWKCHGGERHVAKLDMRSWPLLRDGSQNGPVVVPGSAEQSPLYRKLAAGEMPPGNELKPTPAHLATIKAWIDSGAAADYQGGPASSNEDGPISAADREWWSFRAPLRRVPPSVRHQDQAQTPVDPFLLQRLEAKGLSFSQPASDDSFVRRLYLDLTGLPPQFDALADGPIADRPDQFERLTDRLLTSPRYGERAGRHWLDAAGYVDTLATDNDAAIIEERERIWKYRDYVIRAYNRDKPFDQFLKEQLSGDELVDWRNASEFTPEIRDLLIATGYLRQAADVTYAPELNTADIRHQVIFDTVQIVASNLLGITLHCAQCHTHKFDPITHADYYRFAAFFAPAYDAQHWLHSKDRFLPDVSRAEKQAIDQHNADLDRRIAELNQELTRVRTPFEQQLFDQKLLQLPEVLRVDTRAAIQMPADKRSEVQKYLADKLGPLLLVTATEIDKSLDDPARGLSAEYQRQIAEQNAARRSYDKIQALWDGGSAPKSYVFRRGDFQAPGSPVEAGVPLVLDNSQHPLQFPQTPAGQAATGPRSALAAWLTRSDHPLTARVYVNRVWQQLFGTGIVATPDNFGLSGAAPAHPELLDWLASDFVDRNWSVKQLHRRLVLSFAYRQSSASTEEQAELELAKRFAVDPENQLLSRMSLRRLESEAVRDCMLAVSGMLDLSAGGPPVPLKPNPDGTVEVDASKATQGGPFRRTIYLFQRRNYQLSELTVFDQPVIAHNCLRRTNTAVVLQSLTMLNGPFAFRQAEQLASRVQQTVGNDLERQIEAAFRSTVFRLPQAEEMAASQELVRRQTSRYTQLPIGPEQEPSRAALAGLCQMLLNTNEFLYIP